MPSGDHPSIWWPCNPNSFSTILVMCVRISNQAKYEELNEKLCTINICVCYYISFTGCVHAMEVCWCLKQLHLHQHYRAWPNTCMRSLVVLPDAYSSAVLADFWVELPYDTLLTAYSSMCTFWRLSNFPGFGRISLIFHFTSLPYTLWTACRCYACARKCWDVGRCALNNISLGAFCTGDGSGDVSWSRTGLLVHRKKKFQPYIRIGDY